MRAVFFATLIVVSLPLIAVAQSAPKTTTQIPAGSTAAIGPAKGPGPAPSTPQGKILKNALSSETRATLQEAMDSAPAK